MQKLWFYLVALLFWTGSLQAQWTEEQRTLLEAYEDTIGVLSYAIVNDTSEYARLASCKKLIPTLVKALQVPHSFDYPFGQLKQISIQYPEDRRFRIFTWQLYVNDDEYRYFGAIQMNADSLQLYPLIDRSWTVDHPTIASLSPDQWYGALYYNIKDFSSKTGTQYLLFGYDAHQFFHKRKVVDVLHFDSLGQPQLGSPVFEQHSPDSTQVWVWHRLLLEYGAQASVHLNYDEGLEMVTFDHLIPIKGYPKQGTALVPDGSYEGYQLIDGIWRYRPKLFFETQEEPPMDPERQQEAENGTREKLDIFGRKRKD